MDFIIHVLPGIFLLCIPASLVLVIWIYRYYLTAKEMRDLDGDRLKAAYPIYDEPRLLIAGTVTFFVILMFFLHPVHHKETAWIALIGAFIVSKIRIDFSLANQCVSLSLFCVYVDNYIYQPSRCSRCPSKPRRMGYSAILCWFVRFG